MKIYNMQLVILLEIYILFIVSTNFVFKSDIWQRKESGSSLENLLTFQNFFKQITKSEKPFVDENFTLFFFFFKITIHQYYPNLWENIFRV